MDFLTELSKEIDDNDKGLNFTLATSKLSKNKLIKIWSPNKVKSSRYAILHH